MTGPDDPRPDCDWAAYRSARDRFLSRVRPDAMDDPPEPVCPDHPPDAWFDDQDDDG